AMRAQAELILSEIEVNIQELIDMPVVESMERPHRNAIAILKSVRGDIEASAQVESDPLKAVLANTSLLSLLSRTVPAFVWDFGNSLVKAMERNNIDTGSES
ncbi:MAG: hypothetical protein R3284_10845, partial [Rubricoccaceae bacterium]|nr:hypothetical protein [Rubricoccaceae bacterium]